VNSFSLNPEDLVVESFVADLDSPVVEDNTRTRTYPYLSCRVDCSYDGKGC
jgi:hypothetical protein